MRVVWQDVMKLMMSLLISNKCDEFDEIDLKTPNINTKTKELHLMKLEIDHGNGITPFMSFFHVEVIMN